MGEIEQVPSCGLNVVSTFSGGGGSCTGYRMAGLTVIWANEFEPNAAAVYTANHPSTILDRRDIRTIRGSEILTATGLTEVDILDGSPPCQSFSMAGKRSAGWGKTASHADGTRQRSDDLFFEYIRLVGELRPRVFVAENVAGLIFGAAKGYFKRIMAALSDCGYRVEARLLDAQWLGVPQARRRVFIVGTRADLETVPSFPKPLSYRYSLADACPWMTSFSVEGANGYNFHAFSSTRKPSATIQAGRSLHVESEAWLRGRSGEVVDRMQAGQSGADVMNGSYFSMRRLRLDTPTGTVQASEATMSFTNMFHPFERRRLSIAELRRICSFPDDYVLLGSYAQQWARLGNSVPPLMARAVITPIRDSLLA